MMCVTFCPFILVPERFYSVKKNTQKKLNGDAKTCTYKHTYIHTHRFMLLCLIYFVDFMLCKFYGIKEHLHFV